MPRAAAAAILAGALFVSPLLAQEADRDLYGAALAREHAVRATRSVSFDGLSAREEEVLALLALGKTNAQIAEQLFLSIDTVKTYVRRVFAKLGVHNRTQAAMHAADRSLAPRHNNGQRQTRPGNEVGPVRAEAPR